MKTKPQKPMDAFEAKEMYLKDKEFVDALYAYMTDKGYKWDIDMNQWVDDGSLESEWADAENDKRKGN